MTLRIVPPLAVSASLMAFFLWVSAEAAVSESSMAAAQPQWRQLSPADQSSIEITGVAEQKIGSKEMLLYAAPTTTPTTPKKPIPTQPQQYEAPSQSGIYAVEWSTAGSLNRAIATVSSPPRPTSDAVIILPDYTWAAYCASYGGNLYRDTPAKGIHLRRPACAGSGSVHHPALNPISHFRKNVGEVDVIAQSRLSQDRRYKLRKWSTIVLYGHDEYWTDRLRKQIVQAVKRGSGLLSMSGNTGYRILKDDGKRIRRTGYWQKDKSSQVTSLLGGKFRWAGYDVTRLEAMGVRWNRRTIASLEKTGWSATGYPPEQEPDATGIRVARPGDPIFRGTGLKRGDWIPGTNRVETDGFPMSGKDPKSLENVKSMKLAGEAWNWSGRSGCAAAVGGCGGCAVACMSAAAVNAGKPAKGEFTRSAVIRRHRFGSGQVVSLSSIGWMLQFGTGDSTVLKITDNAFRLASK